MRIRRTETLWFLLVFASLLLAVWWIPGGSSVNTDSYSVAHGGKKAFFRTMQRLETGVGRSVDQLIPNPGSGDRILILGPARQPSAKEWESIYEAVLSGASVVYAVSHRDPSIDAGDFGVRVKSSNPFGFEDTFETGDDVQSDTATGTGDTVEPDDAGTGTSDGEDAEVEVEPTPVEVENFAELLTRERQAETELVEGTVSWRSGSSIELDFDADWDVLVTVDSKPQAVHGRFGLGHFTLLASDEIFSNGAMLEPERALLAYRIIETAPHNGLTWFDETLNASGVPKVFGVLFDPLFRPITLQLLLIAMLFGWLGSRRFGPVTRSTHSRRRSIVEHAEAVGILYMRADAGRHAVKCQFEYLKQELRRLYGAAFRVESADSVARQAQADPREIKELLDRTEEAMNLKRPPAAVAGILRRLAKLLADIKDK